MVEVDGAETTAIGAGAIARACPNGSEPIFVRVCSSEDVFIVGQNTSDGPKTPFIMKPAAVF